jgi:hypothetical protein
VHSSPGSTVADIHIVRDGATVPSTSRNPCNCTDVPSPGPNNCVSSKTNCTSLCSNPNDTGHRDRDSPYPRISNRDSTMSCVPTNTATRDGSTCQASGSCASPPISTCTSTRSSTPSFATHPRTSPTVCSTSERNGSTNTSRPGPSPGPSTRRHNHGNTAAAVFPAPVGTRSSSGNPPSANRR